MITASPLKFSVLAVAVIVLGLSGSSRAAGAAGNRERPLYVVRRFRTV